MHLYSGGKYRVHVDAFTGKAEVHVGAMAVCAEVCVGVVLGGRSACCCSDGKYRSVC